MQFSMKKSESGGAFEPNCSGANRMMVLFKQDSFTECSRVHARGDEGTG